MSDIPLPPSDALALEELFKQHPSLRALHERRQADPADEALRRLALPRTFTRDLYESVLCADLELPFDGLISRPEIEPVPYRAGHFWLRDSAQRTATDYWEQNAQKRARWAERIYEHTRLSNLDPLDQSIQQLRFDPQSARASIRSLYDKADQANDLPRCHLIVDTLGTMRSELAGTPMDADREEYLSRYSARTLFLVEFHRSAVYFQRPEATQALEAVLADTVGRWILHLFAAGGMGKTMFLQWAISRRLVTSPERAFVARLDMDFLSVNALTQCPWLMAIEIGRQIDQQLAAPAFDKFLASLTSFGGLLYSPLSDRYQALASKDVRNLIQHARNQSTNWSRFASIMASLPPDRKIVILMDTIEEASLYYPNELRAIIGQFEALKQTIPQLRLVLSGRYRLGHEHLVSAWDEALGAATYHCELRPFSDTVATDIARGRLPAKSDDLLQAVVRSAAGFPFKLAMLVELVLDDPKIEAAQIEAYRDADVAYVIERVIKRIGLNDSRRDEEGGDAANEHQGLRWVVRYGCIPRKLTLSFLKNVMKPHLDRALTGEAMRSGDDDPRMDVWYPDPDANRDPVSLWQDLTNYSSERGWITVDPHDPELAAFHPDIVGPLRRLLREQRVFIPLHRGAAEHFRARAEREPRRWAEWKAAELYHWSEAGETARARTALRETGQQEPAARLSFLEDVLRSGDFAGLAEEARAEAHLAMADAIVASADYDYRLTGSARESVKTNVLAARTLLHGEVSPFWELWLGADSATPTELVQRVRARQLDTDLTAADRQRASLLLASLHTENSARLEVLASGLSIAQATHSSPPAVPAWVFRRRLAQEHEKAGDLVAARHEAAAASEELEGSQNPARLALAARIVTIDLSVLRVQRAEQVAMRLSAATVELARLRARMHLLMENPWGAQSFLKALQQPEPEDWLLLAEAAAQRLSDSEAFAAFDRAEQGFERLGSTSGVNRVRISRIRYQTLETGVEPRTVLADCPPSDEPADAEILRAYAYVERPGHAANMLRSLERHESPAVRARCLIAGLVWGATRPGEVQEASRRLVDALQKIQPASARLALLSPPLLDGSFPQLDPEVVSKLEELCFAYPEGIGEAVLYGLRRADWLRALGKHAAALELLQNIRPVIPYVRRPNLWPLMALRRRRLIEDRIQAVHPELRVEIDPLEVWEAFRSDPLLHSAVLVETAERALAAGDMTAARQCLAQARPVLETRTRFAEQYRRVEKALTAEGSGAPRQTGDTRLEHPVVVITRQSRRLVVWHSDVAQAEPISVVEDPALEIVAAVRGRSGIAPALTELIINDVHSVARQFDKVVSAPWIVIPDPQVAGVPWELAAAQSTRLLIEDPTLRAQLDRLSFEPAHLTASLARQWRDARLDDETPSNVVWFALPEGADAAQESASAYGHLPRRFQQMGMQPVPLEQARAEMQTPALVYLGCGIEQVDQQPRLTSGWLTAVTLGSMLSGLRKGTRPIVILDPPRPYSLSETVDCLYWRNLLAQQLMDTGAFGAVVGLGLAPYEEQSRNIDRLLTALEENTPLAELLNDVRAPARGEDSIDRIIAFRAAALFTRDPLLRWRPMRGGGA